MAEPVIEVETEPDVDPRETAKILSVDDIASARDVEYAEVLVPEWGGKLRLGSLTAEHVVTLIKAKESPDQIGVMLQLLVESFVDGEGNRSVTDPAKIAITVQSLKRKEVAVIERLLRAFMSLNKVPAEGFTF